MLATIEGTAEEMTSRGGEGSGVRREGKRGKDWGDGEVSQGAGLWYPLTPWTALGLTLVRQSLAIVSLCDG